MARAGSRFRVAEQQAGRNRDVSRAAVAVMTAGSRVAREIERALSDADLTLPQFNVLMELAASPEGSLPMHEVIDRLISTPSNLSFLATRMAERGLVTKQRSDEDARVVVMTITEAGGRPWRRRCRARSPPRSSCSRSTDGPTCERSRACSSRC